MRTFQNLWLSLVMLPAVCFFAGSLPIAEKPVQANPVGSNLAWFFRSTSMFSKSPAFYQQGQENFQAGRYEQAVSTLDLALTFNPKFTPAWALRANALAKLNRYPEALTNFDAALKLGSDNDSTDAAGSGSVWFDRGRTLLKLNRYQEAVISFDQVIAIEPQNPSAWLMRGNALYALKRYPDAIAAYNTALKISPDYQQAIYNRVLVMEQVAQSEPKLKHTVIN
jgi:tetratricopeptide (TPR) repeat protein